MAGGGNGRAGENDGTTRGAPGGVGPCRWRRRSAWLGVLLPVALAAAAAACGDDAESDPGPPPPPMTHGEPNEVAGQMCVVCHTCGDDGTIEMPAPIIDKAHDVCNSCHQPDGSVVIHGEETCQWEMDCDSLPPVVNCDDCHTVEYVNDLCQACHSVAGW